MNVNTETLPVELTGGEDSEAVIPVGVLGGEAFRRIHVQSLTLIAAGAVTLQFVGSGATEVSGPMLLPPECRCSWVPLRSPPAKGSRPR
jgi:hypothetical protein